MCSRAPCTVKLYRQDLFGEEKTGWSQSVGKTSEDLSDLSTSYLVVVIRSEMI